RVPPRHRANGWFWAFAALLVAVIAAAALLQRRREAQPTHTIAAVAPTPKKAPPEVTVTAPPPVIEEQKPKLSEKKPVLSGAVAPPPPQQVTTTTSGGEGAAAPLSTGAPPPAAPSADELYMRAMQLLASGDPQQARQQFVEVIRIDPHYAKAHFRLGEIALANHNLEHARDQFEHALREPDKLDARERALTELGFTIANNNRFEAQ